MELLGDLRYNFEDVDYRIGLYSAVIGLGLAIAGNFLFKEYTWIVMILIGISQLVQVVIVFYENGKSYLGYSFLSVIIYLLGTYATLITFLYFLPLLIVAVLVYIGLAILGSSGGSSCSSCGSYDNGYCHYRRKYVSGGGRCDKYR